MAGRHPPNSEKLHLDAVRYRLIAIQSRDPEQKSEYTRVANSLDRAAEASLKYENSENRLRDFDYQDLQKICNQYGIKIH